MANKKHVAHSNDACFEESVKELLLFRKIVKVEKLDDQDGILTLDNGTQLIIQGNCGCGGCANGWYYLYELNGCDNVITNVKCELNTEGYDDVYNIFIFTEDTRINCVQYRGSDNGYYGVGYDLYVKLAENE